MTMTAAKLAHSLFVTNKHQSDAIIIQFSSAFYIQYASIIISLVQLMNKYIHYYKTNAFFHYRNFPSLSKSHTS